MPRIVGYTVEDTEVSPLFCSDCSDDVNRDLEPLTVEDMEDGGFTSASCSLCGTTFYQNDVSFSPGDSVVLTGHQNDPQGAVSDYDPENELYCVEYSGGVTWLPPSQLEPDPWAGGFETTKSYNYHGTPVEVRIRVGNEASGGANIGERKRIHDSIYDAVAGAETWDEDHEPDTEARKTYE